MKKKESEVRASHTPKLKRRTPINFLHQSMPSINFDLESSREEEETTDAKIQKNLRHIMQHYKGIHKVINDLNNYVVEKIELHEMEVLTMVKK